MSDVENIPIFDRLIQMAVIPVVRLPSAPAAHRAVELLFEAGFRTFEITLTIPDALEVIRELGREGDILVGAGTVLSAGEGRKALEAGARYLVSPCMVDGVAELSREFDAAWIPGACTPNEVARALQGGAQGIKVFPAASVGGPRHIRALRSIFPTASLMPTGGVNLSNVEAYFDAGAACVGVGSELFDRHDFEAGRDERVVEQARTYLTWLQSHRQEGSTN